MQNDLAVLYPQYDSKPSVKLQRFSIAPIGVPSEHRGKRLTLTNDVAEKIVAKMVDSPLLYSNDDVAIDDLPENHGKDGDKRVIGKAIGTGITTDKNGVKWIYADFSIYADANKSIYENLVKNESDVGCSMEAMSSIDVNGNVLDMTEYIGTAIVKRGCQAWETELLVADKGVDATALLSATPSVTVTYDDVIKTIVGNDYNAKLTALTTELGVAKQTAIDLADRLAVQQTINQKLVENQKLLQNLS